jgi:hypothetical protein
VLAVRTDRRGARDHRRGDPTSASGVRWSISASSNRGGIRVRGELRRAVTDFDGRTTCSPMPGSEFMALQVRHNLGWTAATSASSAGLHDPRRTARRSCGSAMTSLPLVAGRSAAVAGLGGRAGVGGRALRRLSRG